MKRKVFIFFILFLFIFNAYPFWIWSPKTKRWTNPKYSPLVTPFLQFKEAEKYFEEKKYKEAYNSFKKLVIHYPDSQEAAEAQYYMGRCMEELKKPYQAFLEYQKVIDRYPNSKRINEIIERQYNIGEYFLNVPSKKWLGISVYDFIEHPSIEIFKKILEKSPYSDYAPVAGYKLGILFLELRRYDEAKEIFEKVIDNYPESEWAIASKYQIAVATSKAHPISGYDSTDLKDAEKRLDEFVKRYPNLNISEEAKSQLVELREREAKKNFDIAKFYEKQKKYNSAIVYYNIIIENYYDTKYYNLAEERVQYLKNLIEKK